MVKALLRHGVSPYHGKIDLFEEADDMQMGSDFRKEAFLSAVRFGKREVVGRMVSSDKSIVKFRDEHLRGPLHLVVDSLGKGVGVISKR